MDSHWKRYLKDIGLGKDLRARVESIIGFYIGVVEIEPDFLFVSEYRNRNQPREYESIWLCSDQFLCEAKNFTEMLCCDYVPFDATIKRWAVRYQDFDWESATDESRMALEFDFDNDVYGRLLASGRNCDKLAEFLNRYIKPRIRNSQMKSSE